MNMPDHAFFHCMFKMVTEGNKIYMGQICHRGFLQYLTEKGCGTFYPLKDLINCALPLYVNKTFKKDTHVVTKGF